MRKCAHPVVIHPPSMTESMEVPCGQCGWCRIRHCSEWTGRLYAEHLAHGGQSAFFTHTFNEECRPPDEGPKSFVLGMPQFFEWRHAEKMSRRRAGIRPLRYFMVAELGDRTKRQHHHILSFGDAAEYGRFEDGQGRLLSNHIRAKWQHGFINVRPVDMPQINYVAQYIRPDWMQLECHSQSNGIGKAWAVAEARQWAQLFTPGPILIPSVWELPSADLTSPVRRFPRARTVFNWQKAVLEPLGFEVHIQAEPKAGFDPETGQFVQPEIYSDTSATTEKMRRIMNARRIQSAAMNINRWLR